MIYLIGVTYYDKETKGILDLLKIGFTDDKDRRLSAYKYHNPGYKLLGTIDDGTMQDETNLHYHFRKYKYPDFGNEWFIYNDDIVNFINSHKTSASLLSDITSVPKIDRKYKESILSEGYKLLNIVYNITGVPFSTTINKEIRKKALEYYLRKPKDVEELRSFIEDDYNLTIPDIDVSSNVKEHIEKLNAFSQFPDKMKYLCDCSLSLSQEDFYAFLDSVPMIYKNYYLVLGEEKIKAFSYRKAYLEAEYNKQMSQQENKIDVDNLVFNTFIPGQRYTKSSIKSSLRDIYSKAGYIYLPLKQAT